MAEREPATKTEGRVIITYARSWQALSAIRSLGHRGVEVIAGDEYGVTPGSLSRYSVASFRYPSHTADPEGFLDAMSEAVDKYAPSDGAPYVLMPIHRETHTIAKARDRFEDRIRVPLAESSKFDLVGHKGRLARYAEQNSFPVPRTWIPVTDEELERVIAEVTFPAFVKLPASASGVGVQKVANADELLSAYRQLVAGYQLTGDERPIVQVAADGDDYCVTALFDRGNLRAALTYRNVMTYPRDGGPGVVRETVAAPLLERIAGELLGKVGWHGIAQVDFRWTGEPERGACILEVNPRFFGGLFQAIESGMDYPWLLFRLAVDGHVNAPAGIDIGKRTETPVVGLLATISEIAGDDVNMAHLESSWERAKDELERGHALRAAKSILTGLRESLDVEARLEHAKLLLEENSRNVSLLFDADDPLPMLGLVYPLAVFVRHGKISRELLAGTEGPTTS